MPRSAGQVAQFSFAELCGRALGAADYLEITQRFRTLFVKDVPRMGLSAKDKVGGVRISTSDLCQPSPRHGDSLRSSIHATTVGPGCSYRPRFPSLRSSQMTRILGHVHIQRMICVPLWTNWYEVNITFHEATTSSLTICNRLLVDRVCQPRSWVLHQCSMARRSSLPLRGVVRVLFRWGARSGWNTQGGSQTRTSTFLWWRLLVRRPRKRSVSL